MARETRKVRADALLALIKRGPQNPIPSRLVRDAYDLWFSSWVNHELIDLIPELRKAGVTIPSDTPLATV